MLVRRHAGRTLSPERIAMPLPGGVLLAMPSTDGEFACTKLVTLHEGNPARGLPTLIGEAILIRADTGARRERLLVFGSGVQARAHVEAFRAMLPLREVTVHSRNPRHARAFAQAVDESGLPCRAVDSPVPIAGYDLVVTATSSCEPLFDDDPRFDGFIAAIGAYRPGMCELPAALLQRAVLFADDVEAARSEAGDLIRADVDWARVAGFERVAAGEAKAPAYGPVVFKSVGQALWDLAACRLAWARLQPGTER